MRLLLIILVLCGMLAPAHAQQVRLCVETVSGSGPTATSCQDIGPNNPLPVQTVGYPSGTTPITGNSTGTTGAVVGTLAAVAKVTTYICGFDVSAIGGTAAVGPITVAGLITSSMTYELASTATGVTLSKTYTPCIPASAVNTAITITTTADGSASAVAVNSWGYQQ